MHPINGPVVLLIYEFCWPVRAAAFDGTPAVKQYLYCCMQKLEPAWRLVPCSCKKIAKSVCVRSLICVWADSQT